MNLTVERRLGRSKERQRGELLFTGPGSRLFKRRCEDRSPARNWRARNLFQGNPRRVERAYNLTITICIDINKVHHRRRVTPQARGLCKPHEPAGAK